MIRRLLLLIACAALLFALSACTHESTDPIVGTWTATGRVFLDGQRSSVTITVNFRPDGTFTLSEEQEPSGRSLLSNKQGKWTVDRKTHLYTIARNGSGIAFPYRLVGDELRPTTPGKGLPYHRRP